MILSYVEITQRQAFEKVICGCEDGHSRDSGHPAAQE
jgi:hypothetical protein